MNLIVCHYHLRPGGIRRIIELATPHLARQFPDAKSGVILVAGEAPDAPWLDHFRERLHPLPLRLIVEPAVHYVSEQSAPPNEIAARIRQSLSRLLQGMSADNSVVWAHNLSIARNLLLARELIRVCDQQRIPLIAHHHDWWFDNRWLRWPEIRRCGFRSLASAAEVLFPRSAKLHHAAINHSDARILRRHFSTRASWLPNLSERAPAPAAARLKRARNWLQQELRLEDAPVWIVPCRLLRRKNIAEALLLARWLRPEACLITTGGVSSADEQHYAAALAQAARRHDWRLCLSVLHGGKSEKPGVAELLAVSEVVLLTSIQEGFGLPYLEAAASERPLIARLLPNIAPDLAQFGFKFAHSYRELLIDTRLFDWRAERLRQRRMFHAWRNKLPQRCRGWVETPPLVSANDRPAAAPFSRLTLTAQLEVLAHPLRDSWALCEPLNDFLAGWRKRAAAGGLPITRWPRQADRWLSGRAYAERFADIAARAKAGRFTPFSAAMTQEDFIRQNLGAQHLFPLLWSTKS